MNDYSSIIHGKFEIVTSLRYLTKSQAILYNLLTYVSEDKD